MSDNKISAENLPNSENKTKKPDFADISFGKPRAADREAKKDTVQSKNDILNMNLNSSADEKTVENKEPKLSDKADKKFIDDIDNALVKNKSSESDAVIKNEKPKSAAPKTVSESKTEKKVSEPKKTNASDEQSTSQKAVPNLNLKGIKVDSVNDVPEKHEPQIKKAEDKKSVKTVTEPKAKTPVREKTAVPKKSSDNSDNQKTMVMKDTSDVVKTDKKAYINTNESKNVKPVKRKKKNKKAQSSFNNSIFGGFFLAFGIVVIAFVVAIGGISLGKEYLGIDKAENDITFNIPQGSTSSDIADMLEENQIISNKLLFRLALKFNAPDTIYPGDITLQPSMGYSAIIEQLGVMREKYETVTIAFPEGVTLLEVAQKLEEQNVCKADDFLFEFNKKQGFDFEEKIEGNKDAFYEMEGYFFPDTYEFYVNDTAYNITKTVREHFSQKFTDKMYEKMEKSNLSLNEVMILASMVQWESGSAEDMPKVASVFLNRWHDLDTFPSFQSDATEKYIDKVIKIEADTTEELEHYTEGYDTYNYKGLPSGPICNPGLDAINAVLEPEKTDYYYFCNNLKTGKSFFASTLEEHEANLKKAGLT